MKDKPKDYIPALGRDWLLPLYDPLLRWIMREDTFKRRLVYEARITPGQRVLDLGCGTATLTILTKRLHPEAEVIGLDGDTKALAIGQHKADKSGIRINLDQGLSYELPYAAESFDRVLSSLVFHHLTREHKVLTLREVWRILKPGGILHIVDFGKPLNPIGIWVADVVFRGEALRDNLQGRLVTLMRDSGFENVEEYGRHGTIVGSLSFLRGSKGPV